MPKEKFNGQNIPSQSIKKGVNHKPQGEGANLSDKVAKPKIVPKTSK